MATVLPYFQPVTGARLAEHAATMTSLIVFAWVLLPKTVETKIRFEMDGTNRARRQFPWPVLLFHRGSSVTIYCSCSHVCHARVQSRQARDRLLLTGNLVPAAPRHGKFWSADHIFQFPISSFPVHRNSRDRSSAPFFSLSQQLFLTIVIELHSVHIALCSRIAVFLQVTHGLSTRK
jgi:hypothetical protein